MNIHLGLHFTSDAYIDLQRRGGIMFDECVAGVDELVRLLNLHLGNHVEELGQAERQAAYHAALSKVADKKTLSESWKANSLGVSNECLKWRDALVACGWRSDMAQPSERLQVIAEAEKDFDKPCAADHLVQILPMLKARNPLPEGSKIYVAAPSLGALPPVVQELLSLLSAKGTELIFEDENTIAPSDSNLAKVQNLVLRAEKNELATSDNSLEIWHFPTALDAYRYIATHKDNADLYICNDTKTLDNVQRMMCQPTSGSKMSNAHPQIAQLFKLGITLFDYPFNIRNLVSWLMMPHQPLPSSLRRRLAKVITDKGGIHNSAYDDAIKEYKEIAAKEAEEKKEKFNAKRIDDMIRTYIPTPCKDGVDREALCGFLTGLRGWCKQRTNIDYYTDIQQVQFAKVGNLCDAMLTIIGGANGDILPYRQVESWASSLYNASDFALYESQAGSRWTTNASDIVDTADTIIWT
ncbi:MAG: hypothetical protein HUK03_09045, partial [Bacteroidaceae bacterium]|nr:hypothetical protein [Bacteroidaceae bacterium]